MTSINIRAATADDAEQIGHVVRESWLATNRSLLPADTVSCLEHSDSMSSFAAEYWRDIWVAEARTEHAAELVGVVGVNPNGVIWMLYVLPGFQGHGVGSALYDLAIGSLKHAGRRKAMLEVLAANENAVAFYRSRGWVPEGRRTEHIPGFRFTAVRMGLALA
jgi:ribosomal protein S18 acetylase RimI-like enzyme